MGLRELKRLKTRNRLADIALALFLERGFHEVTVAEIARLAEVSVTTLFKYFPSKESLVFDASEEIEERIKSSIHDRAAGVSILDSLEQHFLRSRLFNVGKNKDFQIFLAFVRSHPELLAFERQSWMGYEHTLAQLIHEEAKCSQVEADTIAFLILDGVNRAKDSPAPKIALKTLFAILKKGWDRP